ncbi:MAG TPA: FtsX-like permease family protein [Rubrobacteraceae bacterium]|nr:FtsX-like permease family protein [Rubrobacteraceae bacterium]
MDELFGIPAQQLTRVLLGVFAAGALILAAMAARDRTSLRMAVRNIPRRRAQTALIVVGLMLATALFSAAFTTGDTLTNSLRVQALETIGRVDVVVLAERPGGAQPVAAAAFGAAGSPPPAARERYFDGNLVGEMRERLSGSASVAGVAPLARETVPVTSPGTDLSEPRVDVMGMDADAMQPFDKLETASGETLAVGELGENEVYLSAKTAEGLGVDVGDEVEAALFRSTPEPEIRRRSAMPQGPPAGFEAGARPPGAVDEAQAVQPAVRERPPRFEIAGVYESGANPGSDTSMVMPLGNLQRLVGEDGRINEVLITHGGPAVEGGKHTASTVDALRPLLADNGLEADPVKREAVEGADRMGETFSTLFVLFGQFSVAAGMLLIFLIFVMLAAERKRELGIARAVGMQRSHLIRAFAFEGALYALAASTIGSIAGVGVGWGMVRLIGQGIAGEDFRIAFSTSPSNVVLAFCMGMVLTFAVVLISSWRVSRLNVVRAIRDIPEPDRRGRSVWGVIVAVLVPLAGAISFWQGLRTDTTAFYLGGLSLVLIGAALLARVLGVSDRVAFTASALGLLALWLTPASITTPAGMARGPEMFFVSGIALVVAGVWLVVFNADAVLWLVVKVLGRVRGLPPVLKTAVKYPTRSLFRTGMTLAMFMLVVFTLTAMNFIQVAMGAAFGNTQRLSGGFEIRADAGYAAPISDMKAALEDASGVREDDVRAVGQVSNLPLQVKQKGADRDPESLYVQGVDEGYTGNVGYGFETTAREFGSAREVWRALQTEQDTVVISSDLAPSRDPSGFGGTEPPVKLTGFYLEDASLPDDLYLRVKDPASGETRDLRVIGVLGSSAYFAGDVVTSRDTLEALAERPLPPRTYYFDLGNGVDAEATARTLESQFARSGLQTEVTAQTIRDNDATRRIVFVLLRGFMSLGLVVGICALGVIAARAVVERRQQIGMMRALGFQSGQVRLVFLIESSFIALLGIGFGVALAVGFSGTLIENIREGIPGMEYRVPWSALVLVVVVGYAASLLTTYLPARRASRVYPAEALRYE